MVGPFMGGRLTDLTSTFGWASGRDALASLFGGFVIGFLKRSKEFRQKEALDKLCLSKGNMSP
jgi:hypothetical protein